MTPLRTLFPVPAICVFVGIANAASAQAPTAPDQPLPAGTPELVQPVMDRMIFVHGILDQFEGRTDGRTPDFRWSGEGWIGTDYDKFWVKTEGFRRSNGTVDDGQHEFLYSRAITTYFDLQGGLRSDIDSRPTRNWAALGFEGLAPYFFNVQGTGYVSDSGHFAARSGDGSTVDRRLSGGRLLKTGNNAQERGFPAARRSNQAYEFSLRDRQVDRRQSLDFVITDRKAFGDTTDGQDDWVRLVTQGVADSSSRGGCLSQR